MQIPILISGEGGWGGFLLETLKYVEEVKLATVCS